MGKVQNVWLIQRGTAREFTPGMKTGDYVRLDYMGSAEFEFGAFPRFQREIEPKLKSFTIHSFDYVGGKLYFACQLDQVNDYVEQLTAIVECRARLKESMRLEQREILYVGKKQDKPLYDAPHAPFVQNVWFDLTNHILISRSEEVLVHLFETIPNSVRFMDQQAVR